MMKTKLGEEVITQLSRQSLLEGVQDVGMQFLPKVGPEITWDPAEMRTLWKHSRLPSLPWKGIRQNSFSSSKPKRPFSKRSRDG